MSNLPTLHLRPVAAAIAGLLVQHGAFAASTDIANVPMAVSNMVTPNVLVIYDNSQSMDALMNGVMVSGNNANTRGNIGRSVMRNAISGYRTAFNWGLMTYGMSSNPPTLYSTYAYYMGSSSGMVFTGNCTGYAAGAFNGAPPTAGTSTAGGGRCIANPQPSTGREFVTFDFSSDDPVINDVLYYGSYASSGVPQYNQMWAPASNTANPTSYQWYGNHTASVSTWNSGDFSSPIFSASLTPTDAGFIPSNSGSTSPNNISRSLYIPRGWGYLSNVTGAGFLNEAVKADSATHFTNLQNLLANETNGATGEIKNGAVFTTLRGTLATAKSYFAGSLSGQASPVGQSCQQNFVMLVTDGLPTGDTSGNLYSAAARANNCSWSTSTNSCTGGSFGTAATDAISAVGALRATTVPGVSSINKDGTGAVTGKFDIQTYVVALGSTVANANALSVMNAMANAGGTRAALPAGDSAAFQTAVSDISDDITAKVGAAAAVAVANAHVTSTDNASYASSYNSGTWSGDLNANAIDVTTGVPAGTSLWTGGSAATQLDARSPSSRFIVTASDTAGACGTACGVQFQPTTASTTKVSSAQQTLLNSPSASDGAAVLAYLRGDRSGESAGTYRLRAHLMGDAINAEPVLVKAPAANYSDAGYATFKSGNAGRTRVVFQGANDGMLHAFVASTGAESWAYVPNLVLGSLNNLSRKTGFTHLYTVDGTPVSADVDFRNVDGATGSGSDWRTILVSGLAKGGRGYYALDVTTPTATSEADAAGKVLWEFPNSVSNASARASARLNMGWSFGKPVIVKTAAKGWVVLVTSGYNNGTNPGDSGGDGLGHLFVLNPKTGDLIKDIPTMGCGTSPTSTPCGLAQISAWVANGDIDNTTDYIYGGDLNGNVWRFDLTGNAVAIFTVARFAVLRDAGGSTQPVTTAPELALNGSTRTVLVGTGQYLGATDIPGATGANVASSQTQSVYGLQDKLTALPEPLRPNLQQQTFTTSGNTRTSSNNAVDFATKKGWYLDLPGTGERLNTDPVVALSALIFTTNIPSSTVCQPGGSSWEYFINFKTGGLVDNSTVTWSGEYVTGALGSRPVLIQLPSGKVVSLVRTSDAQTTKEDVPVAAPGAAPRRISWRELFN